jgi:transketolase
MTPAPPSAPSDVLAQEAELLRREIVAALHACGGGHYGGSLSVLDILLTLYRRQLRADPRAPRDPSRDRLILSKGHAALALYAVLRRVGYLDAPLEEYARTGSPLEGHPDMGVHPGVDFSTGSLGQGLSVGAGMALALRGTGAHVWVVLGDGECQEGQVWEAAMFAARHALGNLHAVVDANGFQEWGWTHDRTLPQAPVPEDVAKWRAFGWSAAEVDGHDHAALAAAFGGMARDGARPSVALARTVKGKGFSTIVAEPIRFHCTTLTDEEHGALLERVP